MDNTQLPAEVTRQIEQQAHDATCALFSPNNYDEFIAYRSGHEAGATEYATKLQFAKEEREILLEEMSNQSNLLQEKDRNLAAARTLLEKLYTHYMTGHIAKEELINEIKTFLDGTK